MSDTLTALAQLSAAEEFFEYFSLPYDPPIVQVNRLHILKRFNQYLRTAQPSAADLHGAEQFAHCKALLLRAYEDFIRSTPAKEKVFKVFQDVDGAQHVGLDSLRRSLPSRAS